MENAKQKAPKLKETKKGIPLSSLPKDLQDELKEQIAGKVNKSQPINEFIGQTLDEILGSQGGLADYEIKWRFTKKSKAGRGGVVLAEIGVSPEYLNATITLRPEFVKMYYDGQHDQVRRVLCHELAHIRTEKLARLASDRYLNPTVLHEEIEALTELHSRLMYKSIYPTSKKVEPKKEKKDKKSKSKKK